MASPRSLTTTRGRMGSLTPTLPAPKSGRYKYQRLAALLEEEIRTRYIPGQRFASEPDLCKRFKLNRGTVRKVIFYLAERKLLERRGRRGNFVTDFDQGGYDCRLVALALAIRNHLMDQVYLSLSNQCLSHHVFAVICDFSGSEISNIGASYVSADVQTQRLKQVLALRPRSLVTDLAGERLAIFTQLGPLRYNFRNLVLINQEDTQGFHNAASVTPDRLAAWRLAGVSARRAGYRHVVLFYYYEIPHVEALKDMLATGEGGGFDRAHQHTIFEHDADWQKTLVDWVVSCQEPVAVLAAYDYGAHLALTCLKAAGVSVPAQAGVIGQNNTPWSISENITTIAYDPDTWARTIFEVIHELERNALKSNRTIPPSLIQRSSTMPASADKHSP